MYSWSITMKQELTECKNVADFMSSNQYQIGFYIINLEFHFLYEKKNNNKEPIFIILKMCLDMNWVILKNTDFQAFFVPSNDPDFMYYRSIKYTKFRHGPS